MAEETKNINIDATDEAAEDFFDPNQRIGDSKATELSGRIKELENEREVLVREIEKLLGETDESNRRIERSGEEKKVLEGEIEGLRKGKEESEKRVRELERKVRVLEEKELEEKRKRVRVEEDMRERIGDKERETDRFKKLVGEKEREIDGFKNIIGVLESETAENRGELEKLKLEKDGVEEGLRLTEKKAAEMEVKMVEMVRQVEEGERVIRGLKEKVIEPVNGSRGIDVGGEKGLVVETSLWPVVAAGSVGAIAGAAVVLCVWYSRRR